MKFAPLVLIALAATGSSLSAHAQSTQELSLRSLAATCAQCHGTDGQAQKGSAMVSLAGLPKEYIAKQLKDFQSGARPATIMHQLAKGYSNAQIEQLASYFSAQKK